MFKIQGRAMRRIVLAGGAALAVAAATLPFHADAAAGKPAAEGCPMHGAMHGGMGPMGEGMHAGPGGMLPGRMLKEAGASDAQIERIKALFDGQREAARADHEKMQALHEQMRAALAAPTVDRAALDALRSQHLALADAQSRRMTGVMADAAEVLTPEQRAKVAKMMAEHGRHGDGMRPGHHGPDGRPAPGARPMPEQPPTS